MSFQQEQMQCSIVHTIWSASNSMEIRELESCEGCTSLTLSIKWHVFAKPQSLLAPLFMVFVERCNTMLFYNGKYSRHCLYWTIAVPHNGTLLSMSVFRACTPFEITPVRSNLYHMVLFGHTLTLTPQHSTNQSVILIIL